MRSSDQNRRLKANESEAGSRKYNYLTSQNTVPFIQQSTRPIILQTISQEALSQDKGSISNRSQNNVQNHPKIYKNLSERNFTQNRPFQFKPSVNIPIRNSDHPQDIFNPSSHSLKQHNIYSFERKPPLDQRISQNLATLKAFCYQCALNTNKINELQTSYQLLLQAKNQELQECKIIIICLEDKLKQVQKRSQLELEKNKKFRFQIQRKNTEESFQRERQNQMIEYLKNRQIVLLEQMKELQNQIYVKEIKGRKMEDFKRQKDSMKKLNFNSKAFNSTNRQAQLDLKNTKKYNQIDFSENNSVSEYSAKTFEQQLQGNDQLQFSNAVNKSGRNQLYSSSGTKMSSELVQRVPLSEIFKKSNQIESLKDDLLVSELKIKIQQTKSLENLLLIK